MVKEAYVSFDCAKLLKGKGFPQTSFRAHYIKGILYPCENRCGFGDNDIIAPTQQMATAWLREQNNLYIEIRVDFSDGVYPMYDAFIINLKSCDRYSVLGYDRYSYYDAVETSLKYCLTKLI